VLAATVGVLPYLSKTLLVGAAGCGNRHSVGSATGEGLLCGRSCREVCSAASYRAVLPIRCGSSAPCCLLERPCPSYLLFRQRVSLMLSGVGGWLARPLTLPWPSPVVKGEGPVVVTVLSEVCYF